MPKAKRPHTDTTLKLPSDFTATVKALLATPPAAEILKAERPRRGRKRKPRRRKTGV